MTTYQAYLKVSISNYKITNQNNVMKSPKKNQVHWTNNF